MNILLSDSRLLKTYGLAANKRAIKKFDANIITKLLFKINYVFVI